MQNIRFLNYFKDFFYPECTMLLPGGVVFDIFRPDYNKINLNDIARGLSNICRFNGQVDSFYSVAEHSVNVAKLLGKFGHNKDVMLAGLFHDAAEAYCGDVITPLKKHLGKRYSSIESKIQDAISKKFNINFSSSKCVVKFFDKYIFEIEKDYLKYGIKDDRIMCYNPTESKTLFIEYAESLF